MSSDSTKAEWRPKYQSEFSMGQLEFGRYNDHLKFIEYWCGVLNSSDVPTLEAIQNYFAGLVTLYKLWRPLIVSSEKMNKLDNKIEDAKKRKRNWENNTKQGQPYSDKLRLDLLDVLDGFHSELMDIKQIIGLGIVVKKNLSAKERISKVFNKNFDNLPSDD